MLFRSYYSSPKQVGSLTNWLYVSGAYASSFAIKTDGTMWSWGSNLYGSLGVGNTTNYSSPKQIGLLTTWSKLPATNINYGCSAIKTDGTMWVWGYNNGGKLGLGDTVNRSNPTQLGTATNWLKIANGYNDSFGIR